MGIDKIQVVGVVGAGIMGASIAQIMAQYGYEVVLYNHREVTLEKAKKLIYLNQKNLTDSGNITEEESKCLLSKINYSYNDKDLSKADVISESIVENIAIKKEFWKGISRIAKEDAILTSNTSGLSITQIAEEVYLPERFLGMHLFNPPHIIPLIEIIKGDKTNDKSADIIYKFVESINKKPVIVKKDVKGFVANRIQLAVLREAMHIVEDGIADMQAVDDVMKYGLGFRYANYGPFEICDLGGLDTFNRIAEYLFSDLSSTNEISPILADCCKNGDFGVKTGKGFYDYSNGRDEEVLNERDEKYLNLYNFMYKK